MDESRAAASDPDQRTPSDHIFASRIRIPAKEIVRHAPSNSTEHEGSPPSELPASSCEGCHTLVERVERLEQQLAALRSSFVDRTEQMTPALNTTACYWILIGLHAFLSLSLFTSPLAMVAIYPFMIGAAGTLAACHALPKRTLLTKFLRTILSASIVVLSSAIALSMLDSVEGLLPILLFFTPLVVGPALLASQMFVWIGGWRILTPGQRYGDAVPIRIFDYLGITLIAAVYLGSLRFLGSESFDLGWEDGGWIYLSALGVICPFAGIAATLAARGMLDPGKQVRKVWLAGAAMTNSAGALCFLLLLAYESNGGWGELATFVFYVFVGLAFFLVSPFATFFMMRLAGYRIASPKLVGPADSENAPKLT